MVTDLTRPTAHRRRPWWPRAAAVLAAAALLVGCSQSGDRASSESQVGGESAQLDATGDSAQAPTRTSTVSMITTGSVGVVVDDPVQAALAVSELVEASGGRVTEREEVSPSPERDEQPWAHLTVRIPADKLTATLTSLGTLGTVENTTVSSTDVSTEVTDIAARIEALEVSATRLEVLMSEATSTAELLEAEATLTERQSDLEALQAQQARLADQVALSTLTIALTTSPTIPPAAPAAPTGFLGGLQTGWGALTATFDVVVLVLGAALPWLALAGAGYLAYRWGWRRARPAAGAPPASTI